MHTYENIQINIVGAKPNYGADKMFFVTAVNIDRRDHPLSRKETNESHGLREMVILVLLTGLFCLL